MMKHVFNFRRIFKAFGYSVAGMAHAYKKEAAFQQETVFLGILTVIALLLPFNLSAVVLIVMSHLFVLIVELLNTAVEAVTDRVSTDYHELAKQAKDTASAAVLLSFIMVGLAWIHGVYTIHQP